MRYSYLIILWLLLCFYLPSRSQSYVQKKNFPLLAALEASKAAKKLLASEKKLNHFRNFDQNNPLEPLKFSKASIAEIGGILKTIYSIFPEHFNSVINQLKAGEHAGLKDLSNGDFLLQAWAIEARGISNTIAIYAQGKKPNYPSIDSISFNVHDPHDQQIISATVKKVIEETKNEKLFFVPAMRAALSFLELNGRSDAGNYEPMEKTVNRAAVKQISRTDWKKYPYSLILVPGEGPEDTAVLAPAGRMRCDLAVEQYQKGLAPFIMVSGGKVHPYKTRYCEAEEMKKYLVGVVGLPENAVIMEPHARHTTTNLRNAARLIYKYKIPEDKPAVVITDSEQSAYITKMEGRCMKELSYVPYKLGKRVSETTLEFYPVWTANQINVTEPLDP